MNTIIKNALLGILFLFVVQVSAQVDYTYTLVDNGSFNYTIEIVPETSASNFSTSVQSYGFTIIVTDGATGSIQSSLGSGASATFFDGSAVGDPSIDGYLITETLGSPISIGAPSSGMNTVMVTFQLNTPSAAGNISILANDSALATSVTPLQSFLTADTTDDGMSNFNNRVNTPSGLSGTTSYSYMPLSVETTPAFDFRITPNPVKSSDKSIAIQWPNGSTHADLTLIDTQGRLVQKQTNMLLSTGNNTLNVEKLRTGVYFLKLQVDNQTQTKKIIIE